MTPSGFVAFDLDGTLLRGLTVCELLAQRLGKATEMPRIESLTSEADIELGRIEMAAWYDGHSIEQLKSYLTGAEWAPGAHEAVRRLSEAGILLGVVSYTWHFAVEWFAQQLGISLCLGTDLSSDGVIRHVWRRDKAAWVQQLARSHGIPHQRIAAVGDSLGDVDMLKTADLPIFVGGTVPEELDAVLHLPNADLRTVADYVLLEWHS